MSSNVQIVDYDGGGRACLSYHVPVALFVPGLGYVQTATKYSQTTSRHANQFTGRAFSTLPEDEFRALLAQIQGWPDEAARKRADIAQARLNAAAPALLAALKAMTDVFDPSVVGYGKVKDDAQKAIAQAEGTLTMDWGTLPDEVNGDYR